MFLTVFDGKRQVCGVGVGVARNRGNDAGFIMGVGVGADRTRDNDKE